MTDTALDADTFNGLIVVDKPEGMSSMDVVRHVRRAAARGLAELRAERGGSDVSGPKRVKTGHAGTLDPLATGVVICCLGRATKQVERLMGLTKVYETVVDLGAFTTTDDRESEREEVAIVERPTAAAIGAACAAMVGEVDQVPPAFSAIHVKGQRAYDLARRGEAVRMGPRRVRIDAIEVLGYDWPNVRLRVTCGKGTYIRSIGRDLGRTLGIGGHLASLRRTAVGGYRVEDAWPIERFARPLLPGDLMAAASPGGNGH